MNTISFSQLCVGDYFTYGNDPTLFKKAEDYQGHFSFYVIDIDDKTVTRSKRMVKRDVNEDWQVNFIMIESKLGKLILDAARQKWMMKDEAVKFDLDPLSGTVWQSVQYSDRAGNNLHGIVCTYQLQALGRALHHEEIDEIMLKNSDFLEVAADDYAAFRFNPFPNSSHKK